jgi:rhodanese-related sulfurtransferase
MLEGGTQMTITNGTARVTALDAPAVRSLIETNPDVLLVDVRTPGEYESAHIAGSINLPLDKVNAHLRRIVNDAGRRLVLVCQSGGRATQAQHKLTAAGLTDVVVLTGGMSAWMTADAPVERSGKARWALDRQVRLVAGGIVLAAVLASIWFPALRYIAGFIGAGLFFSGLTNFCMMAILLSKLPYNRGPAVDVDAAIARMAAADRRGIR